MGNQSWEGSCHQPLKATHSPFSPWAPQATLPCLLPLLAVAGAICFQDHRKGGVCGLGLPGMSPWRLEVWRPNCQLTGGEEGVGRGRRQGCPRRGRGGWGLVLSVINALCFPLFFSYFFSFSTAFKTKVVQSPIQGRRSEGRPAPRPPAG